MRSDDKGEALAYLRRAEGDAQAREAQAREQSAEYSAAAASARGRLDEARRESRRLEAERAEAEEAEAAAFRDGRHADTDRIARADVELATMQRKIKALVSVVADAEAEASRFNEVHGRAVKAANAARIDRLEAEGRDATGDVIAAMTPKLLAVLSELSSSGAGDRRDRLESSLIAGLAASTVAMDIAAGRSRDRLNGPLQRARKLA